MYLRRWGEEKEVMMMNGAARSVWHCGYLVTIHVTAEETNGRFSLVEAVARRGELEESPMHVHSTKRSTSTCWKER